MIPILDLDNLAYSCGNGSYGGLAGKKVGIVLNDTDWIIKYPQDLSGMEGKGMPINATSPLSEYLGSHIYEILGISVHKTILGERDGKLVVCCKDFAPLTGNKRLLEMRTIRNYTDKELVELLGYSTVDTTHIVDLDEMLIHIRKNPILAGIPGVEDRFFEQAIVDIFINNNDRNYSNWGILRSVNGDMLAPVFDNGACFSTKITDERVDELLAHPNFKENSLNVITAYGKGDRQYYAGEFLEAVKNELAFQKALIKIVPLIEHSLPKIRDMFAEIPDAVKSKEGHILNVCSENRKTLYLKQAEIRLEQLLHPAYDDAVIRLDRQIQEGNSKIENILTELDSMNMFGKSPENK